VEDHNAVHAWLAAVQQLGGVSGPATDAAAELVRRYAEPHRRYHTTAHVEAVVRDASWLAGELGLGADDRALVVLGACAHDVVYDARPGVDERASAEWARRQLAASGVASAAIERVVRLVLATAEHAADDGDLAAAVLLDADLAILGAEPGEYARYAAAVRQEYASATDDEWRVGRGRVLASLLERDPLFRTAPAQARWAAGAQRNMTGELARLQT
jgi:predicted metal-dependent HD superfamily phosphohydrolase